MPTRSKAYGEATRAKQAERSNTKQIENKIAKIISEIDIDKAILKIRKQIEKTTNNKMVKSHV